MAGTAAQVADHLEQVFEATGSRGGFMLGHVVSMPRDLAAIVELLVPELQRRGRFRREYRGYLAGEPVRRIVERPPLWPPNRTRLELQSDFAAASLPDDP